MLQRPFRTKQFCVFRSHLNWLLSCLSGGVGVGWRIASQLRWHSCLIHCFRATTEEPRAYANTPVGMNFLLTGYGYTQGPITASAASPIQGAKVQTDTALLGYSRSCGGGGDSAQFDVGEGEAWVSGTATYMGQPRFRVM